MSMLDFLRLVVTSAMHDPHFWANFWLQVCMLGPVAVFAVVAMWSRLR